MINTHIMLLIVKVDAMNTTAVYMYICGLWGRILPLPQNNLYDEHKPIAMSSGCLGVKPEQVKRA